MGGTKPPAPAWPITIRIDECDDKMLAILEAVLVDTPHAITIDHARAA